MKAADQGTADSVPSSQRWFALLFGAFLGLAILKFGNPVVLDHHIDAPRAASEWLSLAWPVRWAFPLLLIVSVSALVFAKPLTRYRESGVHWAFLALPAAWLGWQFLAAERTVDASLTSVTLRQLSGCVACFAVGFLVLSPWLRRGWLWAGLLLGLGFCLNRAAQQHLFEFRQDYQALVDGQANGWTNFAPDLLVQMRRDQLVVQTNGLEVANPAILDKMRRARVSGTMVYPNALAGLVLLLLPGAFAFLSAATRRMRPLVRGLVLGLVLFLGLGALYWTGSKAGWLVALGVGTLWMLTRPWPARVRAGVVAVLLVGGLGLFGLRFSGYFAKGATSAAARMDYWHAAVRNTRDNPVFGSGPGTFQRPYLRLKPPEAEMARLVHNDYLEQATDSGVPGFVLYTAWIGATLWLLGRRHGKANAPAEANSPIHPDAIPTAVFYGLLAWFLHGFAEFGLYIPAVAWTAFALLGALVGLGREDHPARTA